MPALSGGTMLYSKRSAKSVACSRLKVIGVNEFFFLPVLVAAFTSAEEFHSVTRTGRPAALSHFASSASCVVLPDPSIPSTTNSFPGYSCGVVRLFNIGCVFLRLGAGYFETNRQSERPFERRHVPMGGPQFQLRIAGGAQARQVVVAARKEIDSGERLCVAAVEPFGKPDDGREHPDGRPQGTVQIPVSLVGFFWRRLAVVSRHQRDDLDLLRLEASQAAILDQVIRMPMVAVVTDVHADILQQRPEL